MKKILLSLLWIITLWLINFSSAVDYTFVVDNNWDISPNNISFNSDTTLYVKSYSASSYWLWGYQETIGFYCWDYSECEDFNYNIWFFNKDNSCIDNLYINFWNSSYYTFNYCLNIGSPIFFKRWTYNIYNNYSQGWVLILTDTPVYSSSPWECEEWTWNNWSALYINDIQHNSAGTINITIPEEISRDYTNENDLFELNVEWYNVDTEYIEWIINNQNWKPNVDNFNQLISWLIPLFIPWLVIILFIYFVFKLLKKIF